MSSGQVPTVDRPSPHIHPISEHSWDAMRTDPIALWGPSVTLATFWDKKNIVLFSKSRELPGPLQPESVSIPVSNRALCCPHAHFWDGRLSQQNVHMSKLDAQFQGSDGPSDGCPCPTGKSSAPTGGQEEERQDLTASQMLL